MAESLGESFLEGSVQGSFVSTELLVGEATHPLPTNGFLILPPQHVGMNL